MSCFHCGSFAGVPREGELTTEEAVRLADELAALGCKKVTLSGGEPILRPDWYIIARRFVDLGVRTNIISNGWNWSDEHVRVAKDVGLATVGFSLDGFENTHDTVRCGGSFKRVVSALQNCRAGGLVTGVVTHVNRLNMHDLTPLREFLGGLGASAWQVQIGNPSGSMRKHPELVVPPEEILRLVPEIAGLREDVGSRPVIHPGDNVGYYGVFEKALRDQGAQIDFWIGCRAGCSVIGIESNGNVKGCLSLPSALHGKDVFVEGNVRDTPLAELWCREGAFPYNRTFDMQNLGGFCAVCRYNDICRGGCAWTAYSHTENRWDNPYCFYRQAVIAGRFDLLGEDGKVTRKELDWLSVNATQGKSSKESY